MRRATARPMPGATPGPIAPMPSKPRSPATLLRKGGGKETRSISGGPIARRRSADRQGRTARSPRHKTQAAKAEQHERPGRWFWDALYGAEQTVGLTVDAVGEVEGIRVSAAPAPESQGPKAARRVHCAGVDRDRALERSVFGVEGVDFAVVKAEIADQKVAAELTETGRGKSDAPRRGQVVEGAVDQRLL